jgi:hypothetical protein
MACPAGTRGEQHHDETTAGGLEGVDRRLALGLGDFAGELARGRRTWRERRRSAHFVRAKPRPNPLYLFRA